MACSPSVFYALSLSAWYAGGLLSCRGPLDAKELSRHPQKHIVTSVDSTTERAKPTFNALQMPWDDFSVNLQPDDYRQVNRVLRSILEDAKRLQGLQSALAAVQARFVWDAEAAGGVLGSIEQELSRRAAQLPALGYA